METLNTMTARLAQSAGVFDLVLAAAATDLPMVGARAEAQSCLCLSEY